MTAAEDKNLAGKTAVVSGSGRSLAIERKA